MIFSLDSSILPWVCWASWSLPWTLDEIYCLSLLHFTLFLKFIIFYHLEHTPVPHFPNSVFISMCSVGWWHFPVLEKWPYVDVQWGSIAHSPLATRAVFLDAPCGLRAPFFCGQANYLGLVGRAGGPGWLLVLLAVRVCGSCEVTEVCVRLPTELAHGPGGPRLALVIWRVGTGLRLSGLGVAWSYCHSADRWARQVPHVAVFTAWGPPSQGQPAGDWDCVPTRCLWSLKGLLAGALWVGRARSLGLIGQRWNSKMVCASARVLAV